MPIQIPADAKIVRDQRITAIRIINTLHDRLAKSDGALTSKVKATMKDKDASYAESDLVIAALRPSATQSWIYPKDLYKLVISKKITLKQFLECVSVIKKPLGKHLSGEEIEKITTTGLAGEQSLTTEFKEGVELDFDAIGELLANHAAKVVPIKAA